MECECTGPGPCPRYGRNMTPLLYERCKTRPDYRRQFELLWTDIPAVPQVVQIKRLAKVIRNPEAAVDPCVFRGDKLKSSRCGCEFQCTNEKRGGSCKLADCQMCELYE